MHQRRAIRDFVVNALLSGGTPAGPRVFKNRMATAFRRVDLPAITAYTLAETVDATQADPRLLFRTLTLEVVGAVEVTTDVNVDDALDDLASHIERVLHKDDTLGGAAKDSVLSSTEVGIDENGGRPVGMISLHYTVTYQTSAPDAADSEPLDNFATADFRYSLDGAQAPADRAHDTLTLETE